MDLILVGVVLGLLIVRGLIQTGRHVERRDRDGVLFNLAMTFLMPGVAWQLLKWVELGSDNLTSYTNYNNSSSPCRSPASQLCGFYILSIIE